MQVLIFLSDCIANFLAEKSHFLVFFNPSVKILVFLTMPIEPTSSDIAQQIEYLWGLKSLITCSNVVAIIVSLLESPLENLDW